MKKIIKILLIVLLVVLAGGGGGAAYWQYTIATGLASELEASKAEATKLAAELEVFTKPGPDGQAPAVVMKQKADQLDAVKEALAGGLVLSEVEALDKVAKVPSAERKLGLGALRMLVKGPSEPTVTQAFEEALKIMDIESRISATCAAQAGMRAAGKEIEMMSECSKPRPPAPAAPEAPAPAAAPATTGAAPVAPAR
ncbi:MAG: Carbonic anhydrase precursor [Pseudomonadota bacterium]|jgi:hypothetical protein